MFARAGASGERIFEILDAESAVTEKPDAEAAARRARPRHASRTSPSATTRSARCCATSTSTRRRARSSRCSARRARGKTTVVNLLPRFYDVTGGAITIDGIDIRDVTLASLRANIGIVQQDVFLFSATIRDNISYGAVERDRRGDHRGGEDRPHPRLHHDAAGRLRHLGRRARHHALRRPEAAHLDRAHAAARPADPHPRRLDVERRHADRVPDPAGALGA